MENSFNIIEVAEGIRICNYKTNRFKTGRISFNIAVPLGENASAYAILPYLLSRSCSKYTDFSELNSRLAELYGATVVGSVTKLGESQIVRISMNMIDDKFALDDESICAQCCELLSQLIFNPNVENGVFSNEEVKREKRFLLERIESEKNDKRVYALRRCEEIMCENEAYGINCYGNARDVEALTPQKIYDAWKTLLEKGVIQINVVGNADEKVISELVKTQISRINRCEVYKLDTDIIEKANDVKTVEEKLPINQGKLVMGYRAGLTKQDEDFSSMRVMVDLFGGAPYSKLFMNVREKMSLCYYCSSRLFRQKGIIMVQSGIEEENKEKAIKEIGNQLKEMQNGDFTQDDLNSSIAGLKDTLLRVLDTPEDIDAWGYAQITEKLFKFPDVLAKEIDKVTCDEVKEAAKRVTLDTIYMLSKEEEEQK